MKITVPMMTKMGILVAISYILSFIEFPIPFLPPFLKMDFGELPMLLAAFLWGPLVALFLEFLKSALHLFSTQTMGVGELANFVIGASLVVPVGLIYNLKRKRVFAVYALIIGVLSMTLVAGVCNYFVLIPLYAKVLGIPMEQIVLLSSKINHSISNLATLVIYGVVPFNLLKGIVLAVLIILLYKKLAFLLRR